MNKEIIKALIGFGTYILGITLAWQWYDWKLALILFLVIGAVSSELQDFKRKFNPII